LTQLLAADPTPDLLTLAAGGGIGSDSSAPSSDGDIGRAAPVSQYGEAYGRRPDQPMSSGAGTASARRGRTGAPSDFPASRARRASGHREDRTARFERLAQLVASNSYAAQLSDL
jgi:hypothetical protein